MSTINVSVEGDKELVAKLNKFASGQMDLSKSMGAMSLYLTGFFSGEVFASQGAVYGKKWKALSPAYAKWKAEKFPGRTILIRKTDMIRSFRSKVAPLQAEIFNTDPKFERHQLGKGNLPQRVMMQIDQQREVRIVKYVVSDMTTQLDEAGLI